MQTMVRAIYFLPGICRNLHNSRTHYENLAHSVQRFPFEIRIRDFKKSESQKAGRISCFMESIGSLK